MTTNNNTPQSLSLPFMTRIQVTAVNYVTDFARRTNGTINRRLLNLLDRRVPANAVPINSVSSHDVIFDPDNNLYFRLFIPHNPNAVNSRSTSSKLPIIVFFHGGGFAFLSAASHAYDAVCRRFCRKLNAVVCSVEYRLSPEHKFPAQFNDGFNLLKFLENPKNLEKFPPNADVSSVFLAGDSAGGNLAHNLAVKYSSSSSFSLLRVIGLINIQPFFGGKERAKSEVELEGAPIVSMARTEWLWKAFLPEGEDDLDHWAVNVSGPNAVDVGGLDLYPPTMVVVGGYDPLKDWQMKYYEWLRKNGKDVKLVEYVTAIHAFYVFPELPETNLLFAEIQEFINNRLSKL